MAPTELLTEQDLAAAAVALGAGTVGPLSEAEKALIGQAASWPRCNAGSLRRLIQVGEDPLGDAFCAIRSASLRRNDGAVYTPLPIANAMLASARRTPPPARIVDPGAGSGRFLLLAARCFPSSRLVGVEKDPLAALVLRANLAAADLAGRAEVIVGDYRTATLPPVAGPTLFIGNPPYVRHHLIPREWKEWFIRAAARYGHSASQLAGLHLHFFLATVLHARRGDYGAFITAAEWLDVNYGRMLRELFLGALGGRGIVVIEPTALPFPDAITTAAITWFEIGSSAPSIRMKRAKNVGQLENLGGGQAVRRERLEAAARWSHFTRTIRKPPTGYVELGELCRVHRGQVTGANRIWIAGPDSAGLPGSVLFASITRARELIAAGTVLADASRLRCVIDIPPDLDVFERHDRRAIDRFLVMARKRGADLSFIARNRRAWWSVGLRAPAPILATYMARRPPAFVRNLAAARHINIAHGLYPREPLSEIILSALVLHLNASTSVDQGRTYAGGLTKFEPREMERLLVPHPEQLVHAHE